MEGVDAPDGIAFRTGGDAKLSSTDKDYFRVWLAAGLIHYVIPQS